MILPRIIEDKALEIANRFPILGLIGPRQVGKTTLAKMLRKRISKESLYLDLELPEDANKLSNPSLYLNKLKEKCVILDDIQRLENIFPVLRALTDQHRIPGRFILLGSASPKLIQKSTESLAGRIIYLELCPFNLLELPDSCSMQSHWFKGGFPESLLTKEDKFSRLWQQNFIQTYIERDLPLLGLPATPSLTRKFWTMLAHFHGGIWNASSFAKSMGVTVPTVNRYLDFLIDSFLIRRLPSFYINIKKRLIKSPKIYIRDSGILHSLCGIQNIDELQGNVLIGKSWEGYVIEQISQLISGKADLYYYHTHDGTESDLVIVKGSNPLSCIEIKYSNSPKINKGFKIAINDLGTRLNFIITPQSDDYPLEENITVTNLEIFLRDYIERIANYH